MKTSCKNLDVFDFKEEDELPEMALSTKFNSNPIDKYAFVQNAALGTNIQIKEISTVQCLDVEALDTDQNGELAVLDTHLDMGDAKKTSTSAAAQSNYGNLEDHCQFETEGNANPQAVSPDKIQLDFAHLESRSNDESVAEASDFDEITSSLSPSTSSSAEDGVTLDRPSLANCFGGWDLGDEAVVFYPDFIVYGGLYYASPSLLTFSSSCIEMKGSTAYGNQGICSFNWGINDIIDIESEWSGKCEAASVIVRVISKRAIGAENVGGASSIEEVRFAVSDSDWLEKVEEVTSLHVKYKALWKVEHDSHVERDEEDLIVQNCRSPSRCYFPNFSEPFEEVVYPKGDSDAVTINQRDFDLLLPETFVNDTVIDFYIKYLQNKIPQDEKQRFHFFNSFFFRKLADLDKDPSSAFEGRVAFQRVRKWTRKVNLFEKDYILIPVNYNYHWSLIVICHLGEVVNFKDEEVEKLPRVPCILHMDSIRGSHSGLKSLVQSYLWEEWKEKHKETSEDISSKFSNLRFLSLELPQQQNSSDCGLFLLHYVEMFLAEAPMNFSPFRITKFSNFLKLDWFQPEEASLKRTVIQKLIYGLLNDHFQENSPAAGSKEHCTSNCVGSNDDNETALEFPPERGSSSDALHGNLQARQGIETLFPVFSLKSAPGASSSGLELRELYVGAAAEGSLLDTDYQNFDQTASCELKSTTPQMEEDVEAGTPLVYSSMTDGALPQVVRVTPGNCAVTYSSAESTWNTEAAFPIAGNRDMDSSPVSPSCASDNSIEIKDRQVGGETLRTEDVDQKGSPSTENMGFLTDCMLSAPSNMTDVVDSEDAQISNGHGNFDPDLSGSKNISQQDDNAKENGVVSRDKEDGSGSKSDEQQPAKRVRLAPPPEREGLTRSLSRDLHL